MAASKSNSEDSGEKENRPVVLLQVNDEVRELANSLVYAFDVLLKHNTPGNELPTSPFAFDMALRFSMMLLELKVPRGSEEAAIQNLSQLGRVKNREFISSREHHCYRCDKRDKIRELRASGKPIEDLVVGTNAFLPAIFNGDWSRVNLTSVYERDPLEEPATLQGENFPDTGILIFLEHYLPYELADTVRNLADTRHQECPVDAQLVALLTEFNRCFRSFAVIRSTLLPPSREFSHFLDDAHARLLRLAEIVGDTALSAPTHKIIIREENDELIFEIDGVIHDLNLTQRQTLLALAILLKDSKFSVSAFAVLLGSSKHIEQTVINRCNSLKKSGLNLLEYQFKNKICTLRGVQFENTPPEQRLRKEF